MYNLELITAHDYSQTRVNLHITEIMYRQKIIKAYNLLYNIHNMI